MEPSFEMSWADCAELSSAPRLHEPIVDYGDPYMEMLSIFLRLPEKVIADSSWAAELNLSDVVLVGVKHSNATAVDISLTGDGEPKWISAAGAGARKEPEYVALLRAAPTTGSTLGEQIGSSTMR